MNTIYLDNNATTQVAPEVIETMAPYFSERWGNPSSIHTFGGKIHRDLNQARETIATFLNCKANEIYFTASGSESDNLALTGFAMHNGLQQTNIVVSAVEHPAVLETARYLSRKGVHTHEVSVNSNGEIDIDALIERVEHNTLVSLMWANNETGVIFPIEEIAQRVKEKGGIMHTDAVQAVGKLPIDLQKVPVDMLAFSGHKLHAPKGIGVTFIREGVKLDSIIHGGHQEQGYRAGTENIPYIMGIAKACQLAQDNMEHENTVIRSWRDRLERELETRCTGAVVNGKQATRLPNTLNISFEYVEGEAILLLLDEQGIAASSGSACTTGSLEPSHVMRAMGLPYVLAHSSIRFSFSRYNQESDVEKVVEIMPSIIEKLRRISPFVS